MFQNKIAYWAKEKGVKYKYLAKECGVSVQTFSSWVNNKTQPDLKQSFILVRILGIKIDDLVEEEEE
ncbi:helix-turn-helix transcriptional regulator [Heyndrickxia sporothermodurans]|uniref:helix-turn-helix transcriptional regulator n=1 Tax=Heyndrickxia sporothermodurans TaxID=46224 RepID=UPI002E22B629|nr:helix-turn-helix transcriptional regulator [Heyndrickxia sporothermodurans]MED3697358.1 helix-turn-helix transcriptional regulator [Heyndrickxia sporothermodurans]